MSRSPSPSAQYLKGGNKRDTEGDAASVTGVPDPELGPQVELSGRDARGLLDLFGIGKVLAILAITVEKPPPALLQVEQTGPGRNEDVMDAGVIDQPGAGLVDVVTIEIVSDDEEIPGRIVSFDVGEQGNVTFGIA